MKNEMKNEYENLCKILTCEIIPNIMQLNYASSYLILKNIVKYFLNKKINTLSKNAPTGILTDKKNEERIELRLDLHKTKETIYIDAKYLSEPTNLLYTCYYDIQRAKDLDGVLWIVLFGDGYTGKGITELKKLVHDNVKLIFGADKLRYELNKLTF